MTQEQDSHKKPLVRIFAERELELVGADGTVTPCIVRLGQPQPHPQGDWHCRYEIAAGERVRRFHQFGIDSMQALLLTLQILQVEIRLMARHYSAELRYLDSNDEEAWRLAEDF